MIYYICPKCGSMTTSGTQGSVCLNTMCDWREFGPRPSVPTNNAASVGTANHIRSIGVVVLDDLKRHHEHVGHRSGQTDCETCALIRKAEEIYSESFKVF